jgi:hypothetical protein
MLFARTCYFSLAIFCTLWLAGETIAQSDWQPIPPRLALVEVYYHSNVAAENSLLSTVETFAEKRGGIRVVARDLVENPKNAERLAQVLQHYKLPPETEPAIYGCNQVLSNLKSDDSLQARLEQMFRYDVYSRAGCHRCDEAKELLPGFLEQYPAFRLRIRDVGTDPQALADLNRLLELEKHGGASTPAMHVCNQLLIGFDRTNATPERLHKTLKRWTVPAKTDSATEPPRVSEVTNQFPF